MERNDSSPREEANFEVETSEIEWEGGVKAYMHVFEEKTMERRVEALEESLRSEKTLLPLVVEKFTSSLDSVIRSLDLSLKLLTTQD